MNQAEDLEKRKDYDRAIAILEQAQAIASGNVEVLRQYGKILAKSERYEEALKIFEQALKIEPENVDALRNYGTALAERGMYDRAFMIFDNALEIEAENVKILSSYSKYLLRVGKREESCAILEKLSKLEPNNDITFTFYGTVLTSAGRYYRAFELFEHALKVNPGNVITLTSFGKALTSANRYDRAFIFFEKALKMAPQNAIIMTSYGSALAKAGKFENARKMHKRAVTLFRKKLDIKRDEYISYHYAISLEELGKYPEAISQLETIAVDKLTQRHASIILASLGRLYYIIKQPDKGNEYFDKAIANSDDKEKTLLYSARSIFANDPYSEKAVEMLREITEESSRYIQAREMLTLNLSEEDYFEMVKADAQSGLNDTEMINRAMYHKIANEISILKGIAYRIKRLTESEDKSLNGIIQYIEDLFEKVKERRAEQQSQIENIPENDYQRILAVISQTAHDISDFVNNELPVIESKIRRAMRKLQPDKASRAQFEKLLAQLELTQAALDDLKAINQGIEIRNSHFLVRKLFEKWEVTPEIERANIFLDIKNRNSEFYGDEEKIKSILNELVGNSLKHNRKQNNLRMQITSQDAINPQGIRAMTIPGKQKYLFIEFTDNGKGIPEDKKDWIFQPLKTTSSDKGSGLGLFIIRKTLTKMKGYIRETGQKGARFEIYIPYRKEEI